MIVNHLPTIKKVVECLAREHALRVLEAASHREVSLPEIVSELQIPCSSAYNLVSELEKAGLLTRVRSVIGENGKRFDTWRTLIFTVSLTIDGSCILDVTSRSDTVDRFLRLWRTIAGEQSD